MSTINGTSGAETLTGTSTTDDIHGFAGNDTLIGADGNDLLEGGSGSDVLDGGNGFDTAGYANATAGVTINLKTGVHTGDALGDTFSSIERYLGSTFNDTFVASSAAETFDGNTGTDTVNYATSASAVTIDLVANTGTGGDAAGDVYASIEQVVGSAYDDIYILGAAGGAIIEAANGGIDEVRTANATQTIASFANVENLTFTGTGDFIGTGNTGNNIITGGIGNDTLTGNAGADQLIGGSGTDTASYLTSTVGVTLNLKTGVHTGDASGDTFSSIERFRGSTFNDTFVASAAAETFDGNTGTDTVNYATSASAVTIDLVANTGTGGDAAGDVYASIEQVAGSAYDDIYILGAAGGTIIEAANGGIDEVRTANFTQTIASFANVENLTFTGTGAFTGLGNTGNNIITGGSGNDTLTGNAGADQLIGGSGADIASYSSSSVGISLNLKTGVHTGDALGDTFSGIERYQGSFYNDTFVGSTAAEILDGNNGIDTVSYSTSSSSVTIDLVTNTGTGGDAAGDVYVSIEQVAGSAYNDIYILGAAGGTIIEAANGGIDEVRTANATQTIASFANVENLTFTGTGAFTGLGNTGNNIITGGSGNDTLTGNAGADQLIGGSGTDTTSYASSTVGVTLNLKTGVHTGDASGDTFSSIERYLGSTYNDTFVASAAAETFDGNTGTDTVNYATSGSAVTIDLVANTGTGGDAAGDVYASIEQVAGSAYNDIYILGAAGGTIIEAANGGIDEVRTANATQSIASFANVENLTYTGTGAFTGVGNGGNNVITGGTGNDVLSGGAGADQLIGGGGTDIANYELSAVGLTLNLKTGVHTGDALGDTFSSIERFRGSIYNDTFVGSAAAEIFDGNQGTDTVNYATSASAVTVDLAANTGAGGDAAGDVYASIEAVTGSAYNDIYVLGAAGGTVSEAANGGTDEVRTANAYQSIASFTNVENLTYTGTGAFTGVGNSGNNIVTGGSGNDVLSGGAGADQLIGGGGTDIVNYELSAAGLTLNLKTGVHTGDALGDTFSSIERFRGSIYNDIFVASSAAEIFDANQGTDAVDYSTSAAAVTVDLSTGVVSGGDAAGDSLIGFERVIGSAFADNLTSLTSGHMLQGGAGDDIYVVGNGVTVTEAASEGNDEVRTALAALSIAPFANVEKLTYTGSAAFTGTGNTGNNVITGGIGNDLLNGGAGADQLIGGSGNDSATYVNSSAAITFNIEQNGNTGEATGDSYSSIEKIVATGYDDLFYAGSLALAFDGGVGTDTITYQNSTSAITLNLTTNSFSGDAAGDSYFNIERIVGTAFSDSLTGDSVNQTFIGGLGSDTIDGAGGTDSVWYIDSTSGINGDLATGVFSGGSAAGDVVTNVENLIGSSFNDTLTGSGLANKIEGGAGSDYIYGGAGNDTLYGNLNSSTGSIPVNPGVGGVEADILYGEDGDDVIYMGFSSDSAASGGSGNDTIFVGQGLALGDEGNDYLSANGNSAQLYGGAGNDTLKASGSDSVLFGGEDADIYVYDAAITTSLNIKDDGTSGVDRVYLPFQNQASITITSDGDDLLMEGAGETVRLLDWNADYNTIEQFYTLDGNFFYI